MKNETFIRLMDFSSEASCSSETIASVDTTFPFSFVSGTFQTFYSETVVWTAPISTSYKLIGIGTAESGSFVQVEQKFSKGARRS